MGPNRLSHIICRFGLDSSIPSGSFPLLGILTWFKSGCNKDCPVKKPNAIKNPAGKNLIKLYSNRFSHSFQLNYIPSPNTQIMLSRG